MIADDYAPVREGIKTLLAAESDLEVIAEASDGREAVRLTRKFQPDFVLLDVSMSKLNGLQAAKELKKFAPDAKILMLTRHTKAAYLQKSIKAGVSGYVLKQNAGTDLIRAIRHVAGGGIHFDSTIAARNGNSKVPSARDFYPSTTKADEAQNAGEGSEQPLTTDEQRVLRRIAAGFSDTEIAVQMNLEIETIET